MVDIRRSQSIFDPEKHEHPVLVAGCGATGSHVALQLACLGVKHLTVVDYDTVSEHNLTNQAYVLEDVDMLKVVAMRMSLIEKLGNDVSLHAISKRLPDAFSEMTTDQAYFRDGRIPVMILAVDSMEARREIVNALHFLWKERKVPWYVIDTRMASTHGNIIGFRIEHKAKWEATLIDDKQAEASPCGQAITVLPTVQFIASLAVWEYIKLCTDPDALEERIDVFLKPLSIHCSKL